MYYLEVRPNEKGTLLLSCTNAGLELLSRLYGVVPHDEIWFLLLEPNAKEKEYVFIPKQSVKARTDAPLISHMDFCELKDNGTLELHDAPVWWFPQYAQRDELRELLEGKQITFVKAD